MNNFDLQMAFSTVIYKTRWIGLALGFPIHIWFLKFMNMARKYIPFPKRPSLIAAAKEQGRNNENEG